MKHENEVTRDDAELLDIVEEKSIETVSKRINSPPRKR